MRAKTTANDRQRALDALGEAAIGAYMMGIDFDEPALGRARLRRAHELLDGVDLAIVEATFGREIDILDFDPESPDLFRDMRWRAWRKSVAIDTCRRGGLSFWEDYLAGKLPLLPELERCQVCGASHDLPLALLADTTCQPCRRAGAGNKQIRNR